MFDWVTFQGEAAWLTHVVIVVLIAGVLDFAQRRVSDRLARRVAATASPWDDALLAALRRPLSALIWVLGVALAAHIVGEKLSPAMLALAATARGVAVIGIVAWFLVRFIHHAKHNIMEVRRARGEEIDLTTVDAVAKLARLTVVILAVLVVLQTLGFSISGVLAFGGVGGIAVGFAARDLLANFFGGLMIYLDRPFSVGDVVRSPDRNIEGKVEYIGWRQTRIRTPDMRPLYVPNATFASIAVENSSRMSHRLINETIGLRYHDLPKLRGVLADVEAMLRGHPAIDMREKFMVNFEKFGASTLDFVIYVFTTTVDHAAFMQLKQDILLRVADVIAARGAEIAYPTSTVQIPDGVVVRSMPAS